MSRRIVGSIVAVLLAATGTFVLISYVRAADDRAIAGERVVPVYVVRTAVSTGTPAEQLGELVELERVPAKVKAADAVGDLADLEGKVAAVDLVPGEQLVAARFQTPEALAQTSEVEVPEGLQEVTVRLQPERALGGDLAPGDTVGIVSSFAPFDLDGAASDGGGQEQKKTPNTSKMVFHKVLVTRVQAAPAAEPVQPAPAEDNNAETPNISAPPTGEVFVTLAVRTNAVEKIVFTAEYGSLWLTDEPDTADERPSAIETRGTIYR